MPTEQATPELKTGSLLSFDRLRLPDFGKALKWAGTLAAAGAFSFSGVAFGGNKSNEQKNPYGPKVELVGNSLPEVQNRLFSPVSAMESSAAIVPSTLAGEEEIPICVYPSDVQTCDIGRVATSIKRVNWILENRGMPGLNLRTGGEQVATVQLSQTKSQLESMASSPPGTLSGSVTAQIHQAGYNEPNKLYMAELSGADMGDYYDNGTRWNGFYTAKENVVLAYLSADKGGLDRTGTYALPDFGILNSSLYDLGWIPRCSPPVQNFIDGTSNIDGYSSDWTDLMLAPTVHPHAWQGVVIHTGPNSYLNNGRNATCPDLGDSRFIRWGQDFKTNGSGSINTVPASDPNVNGNYQYSYQGGTQVTLSAQPQAGWKFKGWEGDCTGNGTCQITSDNKHHVTADFVQVAPKQERLTVHVYGNGVVKGAGGIACKAICNYNRAHGLTIVLREQPGKAMKFGGWMLNGVLEKLKSPSTNFSFTMNGKEVVGAKFHG